MGTRDCLNQLRPTIAFIDTGRPSLKSFPWLTWWAVEEQRMLAKYQACTYKRLLALNYSDCEYTSSFF